MSATLPAPLVTAEVDLRDFGFTPMYRGRLFGSSFHARVSDAGWRAGVTLWLKSWDQVPAGTLPDDEVDLCRLAELGRDVKEWRKIATEALWGWFKCSDGRLHHKTVAEGVLEAWQRKTSQRERTEAARLAKLAKRQSQTPRGGPTQSVTASVTETVTQPVTGFATEAVTALVTDAETELVTGSKGQGQGQGHIKKDPDLPVGTPAPAEDDDPFGPEPAERRGATAPPPETPTGPDPTVAKRELFARAEAVLGAKSCGQVTQLLRAKGGNVALARAALETASTAHRPRDYVAGVIRGTGSGLPPGQLYDRGL